jgi:hypothetical protein
MLLNSGSLIKKLETILEQDLKDELVKFLKNENNFDVAVEMMKNRPGTIEQIVPALDEERLMRLTTDVHGVRKFVTRDDNIDKYTDMLKAVLNAGSLANKEEKMIRALLSRRVVDTADGKVLIFVPGVTNLTPDELFTNIRRLAITIATADSTERKKAYDYLCFNLQTPVTISDALNVLCILLRIIEKEKNEKLTLDYTRIIPIMNFIFSYFHDNGFNLNSPENMSLFRQGDREIKNIVYVQGYLDSNRDMLAIKPRLM